MLDALHDQLGHPVAAAQLDGLARVVVFLGAGLVLLAAGTRYARLVASTGEEPGRLTAHE